MEVDPGRRDGPFGLTPVTNARGWFYDDRAVRSDPRLTVRRP